MASETLERWVEIRWHRERQYEIILNRRVNWGMIHEDPEIVRCCEDHDIAVMIAKTVAKWAGCEMRDATMAARLSTTLREELRFDYPALVAASDVMSVAEAQRLGIGEHAPNIPDIDCQDDYEFYTGTGRYAERAEDEEE